MYFVGSNLLPFFCCLPRLILSYKPFLQHKRNAFFFIFIGIYLSSARSMIVEKHLFASLYLFIFLALHFTHINCDGCASCIFPRQHIFLFCRIIEPKKEKSRKKKNWKNINNLKGTLKHSNSRTKRHKRIRDGYMRAMRIIFGRFPRNLFWWWMVEVSYVRLSFRFFFSRTHKSHETEQHELY